MPCENKVMELFSKRLAKKMKEHNLSNVQLANIIDVNESTVGKWLLKKSLPRISVILKLCDYFNVEKSYFLEKNPNKICYNDPEIITLAEDLKNNPELKMLLDASKNISKEAMKQTFDFINFLKTKEKREL